ncbi:MULTISPECIES: DUF1643 domain-containing protein [unclassified Rhizobium]|uniref:DUF1643 domain-containing protein n=1 Tax=unclassified Rhizobium TaxID=2613769 RepID=UPI001607EE53|nr:MULTISPECIES: DUF1643 domain-containing protein [unclassified Rhizobium]
MSDFTLSSALFSRCNCYRYLLERQWDPSRETVAFLMLNPSTADAFSTDPTLRRCIAFARSWGFGGLVVGNLFALRSSSPGRLYEQADPVGPENDRYLRKMSESCDRIVCGWGRHGAYRDRAFEVCRMLATSKLYALKFTSDGHPCHPLYISGTAEPKLFQW